MAQDQTINYPHFFQELLEVSSQPVLIIDRTLTIHFHNQQAVRLFATTVPLQGMTLDQLLDDATILQTVQESIANESMRSMVYNKDKAGTVWKVAVTPLEHGPRTSAAQKSGPHVQTYRYFAFVIDDLTELHRLERVRRDFVANISHELRTPLASIRLLAETLEDTIETDHEQAQIFLERIETEVQHLSALVAELLELSLIEAGQVSMTIEPVAAEQLVREVMARMLTQAQRHRVILRTEIQRGETLVAADSKQIARVLVNLVHNAIKFTASGGTVVIGTVLQSEGHAQCFFVRDTGVGIRSEDLSRIFERFYKVNRARSKADFIGPGGAGSGLGLAIARHVVEAHGGRISAESTVGEGSTFTFTLPVVVRAQA